VALVLVLTGAMGCSAGPAPEAGDDVDSDGGSQVTDQTSGATVPPPRPDGPLEPAWTLSMAGPTNEDEIDGVAAGAAGSVFITGKFRSTVTIGSTVLRSAGAADIPVARISADGSVLWARHFGGSGEDNFFDIDADDTTAVAAGIVTGQVAFDDVVVTSAGGTDCVVAAFNNDGAVRWVTLLGGPGDDGCNEVTVSADGSVTTSLDTSGGWDSPAGPLALTAGRDTLLVRLNAAGDTVWARLIGGDGPQRGKALAVAPDGSIAFGGDTIGPLTAGPATLTPSSNQRSGWLSRWSSDGTLRWWTVWDGGGTSLVKGLADDGESVTAVGPFARTVDVGGGALDAGDSGDLAVVRYDAQGNLMWATSITADSMVTGAEIVGAADGGVVFAGVNGPGLRFGQPNGGSVTAAHPDRGSVWLTHYCPDGTVALATTIAGTSDERPGELSLKGSILFVDMVLRGAANDDAGDPIANAGKDASVWSFTLPSATAC